MEKNLPKKLNKAPLIDVYFELRFTPINGVSNVLPVAGIVAGHLSNSLKFSSLLQELNSAQIPKAFRDADPNLAFSPLYTVQYDFVSLSFSDRSILVTCTYPYPGWDVFKSKLLEIASSLQQIPIIATIDRFSLKYLNLIPAETFEDQMNAVELVLKVGSHLAGNSHFMTRTEINIDSLNNIVEIQAGGQVALNGLNPYTGLVVSVDTIKEVNLPIQDFLAQLDVGIESVHKTNKELFFELISQKTLEAMEPVYE